MKKTELVKLACNFDIIGIMNSLKEDTDSLLYQKYVTRFEKAEKERFIEDDLLNDIINLYCDYYRDAFYKKTENDKAIKSLISSLSTYLKLPIDLDIKALEKHIQNLFNQNGYEFKGGDTSGYYGPYIWKETKKQVYQVDIPEGTMELPLYFMHEFIHNSWLDFLSFNIVGTGGWSTTDGIYCVYERYQSKIETPRFQISFLKHEAQHNKDYMNNDWNFTVPVLEYRAKLCEIAYYPDVTKIKEFLNTAEKDSTHGHSQAEYWVIHDLSKEVFQVDFEHDLSNWEKHYDTVKDTAKSLILSYSRGVPNI